jgi:hypothetical protein
MTDHMEILQSIEPGDVVLVGKENTTFVGCLMIVGEVHSWGVTGCVSGPNATDYPLRVGLENITSVFRACPEALRRERR